mmetsp:Transcript_26186/g.45575  ORF Transcript_26186/g.45575 Transcript_26186/m.45575 type:complete len:94 (+) Transcript_26186:553-834(+)
MAELGGKASKSHIFVQVGEISNLYKTSKSAARNRNRQSTHTVITIDLHGLPKVVALAKLDVPLPRWVDVAMTGEYPWGSYPSRSFVEEEIVSF